VDQFLKFELNFNEKNPMFIECRPERLAALLGCRKNAWIPSGFFLNEYS